MTVWNNLRFLFWSLWDNFSYLLAFEINHKKIICLSKIADGGFGTVFKVMNIQGECFALKRINTRYSNFKRECKWHEIVSSTHVLELLDYMQHDDIGLMLFPLIPATLVDKVMEINDDKINLVFHGICLGLKAFHDLNLAFRDLKPLNILMDGWKPILADLGSVSSAVIKINTKKEAIKFQEECCTMISSYVKPPELFKLNVPCILDERTDVWSLGCILYYMHFKTLPFDGTLTSCLGTIKSTNLTRKLLVEFEQRPKINDILLNLNV